MNIAVSIMRHLEKSISKKEIKSLIHTIEYCKTYLATLKPMLDSLAVEKDNYDPDKWVELQFNTVNKIAETKLLLGNTRNRLRELGSLLRLLFLLFFKKGGD